MKYVTSIRGCECLCTDGVIMWSCDIDDTLEDVVGVWGTGDNINCTVAIYDKKAMKLYDHIFEVHHHMTSLGIEGDYDFVSLAGSSRHLLHEGAGEVLLVDTDRLEFKVGGYMGGVVVIASRGNHFSKIANMYEALMYLCKEARVNVFKYDTIGLFSSFGGCKSLIRFRKNKESEVFRIKMALEAGIS